MTPYSLGHLTDPVLLRDLSAIVARDRANTAALLAHLAEVDARRLYAPAGYPSMYLYCVNELGLSEDGALKRIRVARTAREFPAVFVAIEKGALNLTAVLLLTPFLSPPTADELIDAAAGKCRSELEQLLAARFPRPDVPTRVEPLSPPIVAPVPATHWLQSQSVATIQPPSPRPKVAPLSPERFALQVTIAQSTREKLRRAQALLGHSIAPGNVAEVLDRALDALIDRLEKRKFAKTDRPRRCPGRTSPASRHIPARVQREVWHRDGGRCTFVSDAGLRCSARDGVEFDHVETVARGGMATVSNLRLRCRAHNQYAAEQAFGAGFMNYRRREAAEARAAAKARAAAERAEEEARINDIVPWLRQLGFRLEEARRAAKHCERIPDAPLETRVRAALSFLAPTTKRAASALRAG